MGEDGVVEWYFNGRRDGFYVDVKEHRPSDTNICLGIADTNGSLEVAIFYKEGAINSFDPALAAQSTWAHFERSTRFVEVRRLADVLEEHLPENTKIDYMNVDVEKFNLKVLRPNGWLLYRPELISVETNIEDFNKLNVDPIYKFLVQRGYVMMSQVVGTSFFKRS